MKDRFRENATVRLANMLGQLTETLQLHEQSADQLDHPVPVDDLPRSWLTGTAERGQVARDCGTQ